MIVQIDTEIVTDGREAAEALGAVLVKVGADMSVVRKCGRWTVCARYAAEDAAQVGHAVALHADPSN
ncbi:hypothetical protein [Paracoccus sp. TOH]|uniref:hypothetical protein n=1 Tax=Paracoccus sp. TOH TaxID=1263728 RepID=UPI0025B147FD|nr:hypothetical protein [Paracoccus sp. TOH]WJS87209.1 hypothetical protein NBE95_20230 [Paracoccus sp. TOH]